MSTTMRSPAVPHGRSPPLGKPPAPSLSVAPLTLRRNASGLVPGRIRGCRMEPVRAGAQPEQKEKETPEKTKYKKSKDPKGRRRAQQARVSVLEALEGLNDAVTDVGRHLGRLTSDPTRLPTDDATESGGGKFALKKRTNKPAVLVLGSGWAAHSCIKVIDTDKFDVIVVSPRNHFCFTPMLPSTAVGTVEFRSLLEPIRISNEFVGYLEADCEYLDLKAKVATCVAASTLTGGYKPTFEVSYDLLVVAVGEQPATFGVPGVAEYCSFMKEVKDTVTIRNRIGEVFELAALPGTSKQVRRQLLHFVVVGGGPTGVEFAGTLADFVRSDLKKKYPTLMPYVRVSLLQSAQGILTQFDSGLANKALEDLRATGVEIRTGVRVVQVTEKQVVLKGGEREDYGVCVWSCGNASRPLVQSIVDAIPDQAEFQKGGPNSYKLAVDPFMRVIGATDVVAMGDCSMVVENQLPATAQVAAQQGSYLAHMINRDFIIGTGGLDCFPPSRPRRGLLGGAFSKDKAAAYATSYDERAEQVAASGAKLDYYTKPFEFFSLGIMAYVGNSKAAIDTQKSVGSDKSVAFYGGFAFLLWRSVYITKQVSLRNRVLILFDWLKTRVFGRDMSMF